MGESSGCLAVGSRAVTAGDGADRDGDSAGCWGGAAPAAFGSLV